MPVNANLHPRNLHRDGYPFEKLAQVTPELAPMLRTGKHGKTTIDFANPQAVKTLNAALLKFYFDLDWDIPDAHLCPPIPGRADYIHYLADLIRDKQTIKLISGPHIRGLDIGTGANLIYPLLGNGIYGWQFTAADIFAPSIKSAQAILEKNTQPQRHISVHHQPKAKQYFKGIIQPGEFYHFSMCNPPFYESSEQAAKATARKLKGLKLWDKNLPRSNFAGQDNELWCDGGELSFVGAMMDESQHYAKQVAWFTCLISNQDNVPPLVAKLNQLPVKQHKVVDMAQGNKISRFIAWRF